MKKIAKFGQVRRLGFLLCLGACLSMSGPAAMAQATVRVSGFQVTGNTLLDPLAVDALLLPMLGQRSLEELNQAAAAVQALYAAQGYGAVVAYVPPQSHQGGLVTIAVLEGKVSEVAVSGASRFSAENIKASLPAVVLGTTPRLRDIDTQLRIANENPAKQVQVLLRPGARPGEAEVELKVQEQPLQRFTAGIDNTGNDRTGDYRASLGWQHASISGHDDVLAAQLQVSPTKPSQVRVLSLGYRWPLYARHMALDVFAAYSDVDGGSTATLAGDLRFAGRGRVFGARAGWYLPRWGEFDPRLTVGLDHRAYLNRCDIAGLPTGACGPAGESVAVSPLSLEFTMQSAGERSMALSASLHHNLRLGGANSSAASFEAVRPGARAGYSALRWALSGSMPVGEDWLLRGRLNGQWSPHALVSGEQFGFGGAQSVRGYEERELIGDVGLAASIEAIGPTLLAGQPGLGVLHPVVFMDAGHARNNGDAPCVDVLVTCSAASAGVGLRYAIGQVNARVDLAHPLRSAARTRRGDTRAHVALQVGF